VQLDNGPKANAPIAIAAAAVSAVATYYVSDSARTSYAIATAALAAVGAWTTWAIVPLHTKFDILGKQEFQAQHLGQLASRYQIRSVLTAVALGAQIYGFWTSRWIII